MKTLLALLLLASSALAGDRLTKTQLRDLPPDQRPRQARPALTVKGEVDPPAPARQPGQPGILGQTSGGMLGGYPRRLTPWEEEAAANARMAAIKQHRAKRQLETMGIYDDSTPAEIAAAKKRWREWNVYQRARDRAGSRDTSGITAHDAYVNQAQAAVRQVQGR